MGLPTGHVTMQGEFNEQAELAAKSIELVTSLISEYSAPFDSVNLLRILRAIDATASDGFTGASAANVKRDFVEAFHRFPEASWSERYSFILKKYHVGDFLKSVDPVDSNTIPDMLHIIKPVEADCILDSKSVFITECREDTALLKKILWNWRSYSLAIKAEKQFQIDLWRKRGRFWARACATRFLRRGGIISRVESLPSFKSFFEI
ncbi:hypothetical protein BC829DRAFT_52538 [Chytridium lagenaria]|nr:hypothetical protein BC829DRAFT_52538 [Chytridium lagenaria]